MAPMTRSLAIAAALLATAVGPASAQTKIQPGAEMSSEVGGCTLNFVYDGLGANAGKVYLGTAAHCVEKVGVPVEDGDGTVIGSSAAVGSSDEAATDWAFIEILPEHVSRVEPSVKGHPSYPAGVVTPDETAFGDLIQGSGFGVGVGLTQPTQEQRRSVLQSHDRELFTLSGPNVNGDSGGPFVHIDTGKALGIVSQYGFFEGATDVGPTVEGLLEKAARAGFPAQLRAAGQGAPPPPPQQSQEQQSQPQPYSVPSESEEERSGGRSRSDSKPKGKKRKSGKAACSKSAKRKGKSRAARRARRRCSQHRRSERSRRD